MDPEAPKDFFISYTSADQGWAEWIAWQLEAEGYTTGIQTWDFLAGSNFVHEMDTAAKKATCTIAVLSPDYFTSDFTSPEWEAAFARDPRGVKGLLVPVRVRPCDVEGLLKQVVYIDLVDQNEDMARATLLRGVKHKRRKPSSPPIFPSTLHASQTPAHPSFPGALPAVWNIPYPRNLNFTGREEVLHRLAVSLRAGMTVGLSQPQAVSGLGGVGKTQLALEYAYRYYQDYTAVLWTRADTQEALISGFVTFAALLQLPEQEERDQLKVVQAVKHWLMSNTRWLLLLDNADDLTLVRDFLPLAGRGHTLLTTRAASMGRLAHALAVDPLDNEPGALFLLRRTERLAPDAPLEQAEASDRAIALAISQELGGLPLALDQAGAYIEETHSSLADYLQIYRTQRAELLKARGGLVLDHPEPVATTWSLSFAQVDKRSAVAADLLRVCAFLNPDAIPEEIITVGATALGPNVQAVVQNPLAFNQAIGVLLSYSLVKRQPEEHLLSMHRLVQAVILDELDEQTQRRWAERVVRAVNAAFPHAEYRTWAQCERLLPLALAAAESIEQQQMTFEEAGRLLFETASYLLDRARYEEAELLYQRALRINERQWGPEHPNVATSLNELANLYRKQGKYEEAEPLYQRALRINEQHLGPEHPEVANVLNGLANIYHRQGKYEEAEPLYQRAFCINEQHLGPEHPEVATSLNGLANLYSDQGKYEEAELLYQRALRIREQQGGPEHPSVANVLINLANLYSDQGKYEEAELLYQRALHINEQRGPEHPNVATSLNELANLYRVQGKYEEAEPLYQRALHINEQQWGPEDPEVARSLTDLAELYYGQNKYAEAEPLYWRALRIREQVLVPDHRSTAVVLYSLARLCQDQGKYEQAEPLYQRALAIFEQTFGPEHPSTATTLTDLAALYQAQGKYEEAEALYQRALAIREKRLGPQHPDTALIIYYLANLYSGQGEYEQAESFYQRALAIDEQYYGQNHLEVATDLSSLADLYSDQGKYEQAEPLYQRAQAIYERVLSPEHPSTAATLNDLADLYLNQDKYEQAEPLYLRALAIYEKTHGPNDPNVAYDLKNLAALYQAQGKYAQAELLYRRLLRIREQQVNSHPHDAETYLDRGYAYLLLRKSEDACADFAKCAALKPTDVNAAWMVVYAALGKQRPGVEIAERLEVIAELDPQSDAACVCRGVALGLRGKLQEGLVELEHALSLDAESQDALFWKGMICAYLGRNMEARESIEHALQADLPPVLLTPLYWLQQDRPLFYQEYAEPLLKRYELI